MSWNLIDLGPGFCHVIRRHFIGSVPSQGLAGVGRVRVSSAEP